MFYLRIPKPAWLPLLVWVCAIMVWHPALAQKKYKGLNIHLGRQDRPAKGATLLQPKVVPVFPNINKVGLYANPELLRKVQTYARKQNYRKLMPVLEEYVNNFGIMNFYRNTQMIWQLGQLYQRQGDVQKAKNMYRLALKHKRGRQDSIRVLYDSLNYAEASQYVPLKYYYELVDFRKTVDTLHPPHSVLQPLGSEVNTKFEEYGPAVNRKEDTLYFTSRREFRKLGKFSTDRELNEDLYFTWGQDGYWEDAAPVKEINTDYNEGSPAISPDGKLLYFSRCHAPGGYGNCDIFVSQKQPNGTWGVPKNLGAGVNGRAWDSQPSLSHTGDTLYFASDRIGGFGLSDLYYSVRIRGLWGPAKNMGPVINTSGNEVSPCYHPQYRVLYFSSDNEMVNFGNFDIFKSYYRDGAWQEPYNIGPLVNGEGSEYYFTIDYESKQLYYARSEPSDVKNLDLYSFPLPMEAQPLATTQLAGVLTDSAGKPLEGIVSVIDLDNGIEVAPKQLRKDGSYDFDLIRNNNYLLILQGDDFFRVEQRLRLRSDTSIATTGTRISTQKISFSSVDFEQDSYEIGAFMKKDLDNVLNFLVDHPTYRIRISGHTDLTGDSLANLRLSDNRAQAIKRYLSESGAVKADRIDAAGFGSQQPIIPEERSEDDRRTNRRVEFEILYPGKK